jgi:hypothetical protein
MSLVLDVCTTQCRSLPGLACLPRLGTQRSPSRRVTFVQVHTASLAWAPFAQAAMSRGPLPSRVRGHDKDLDKGVAGDSGGDSANTRHR